MAVKEIATKKVPTLPSTMDRPSLPFEKNYDFNYLTFPKDIGSDAVGHYMIININVQTNEGGGSPAGAFQNMFQFIGEKSKNEQLRFRVGGSLRPGGAVAGSNTGEGNVFLQRQVGRIREAIAIFMPTPLLFNSQNRYEEVSLTALGGKVGVGVLAALATTLGSVGQAAVGAIGTAAQMMDRPINPVVEVLFATTLLRQFTMEWLFAPRNEEESLAVKSIIKTLKFHAAPEIADVGVASGLLWIAPAEFDITFYNKGEENQNILRINTCVIEQITVDYAPTGVYSTFRNGHPVTTRLTVGFKEMEPIHKKRVAQGM